VIALLKAVFAACAAASSLFAVVRFPEAEVIKPCAAALSVEKALFEATAALSEVFAAPRLALAVACALFAALFAVV
jgi:hypothetical protein